MSATTLQRQSGSYLGLWCLACPCPRPTRSPSRYMAERFNGNLKLMITAPVSKFAYVAGTLIAFFDGRRRVRRCHPRIRACLRNRHRSDVDLLACYCVGRPVLVGPGPVHNRPLTFPSQIGNMMANIVGIILAMVSPVFFTMEQAPLLLRWLGYVSPLRYAADGLSASLTGRTDVSVEIAVLTVSASCWPWPSDSGDSRGGRK